jgi:hypothetical protein
VAIAYRASRQLRFGIQLPVRPVIRAGFDYLKKQNHHITGYVIMPNHVHVSIDFTKSTKKINTIVGDGKRFMAYDIISILEKAGNKLKLAEDITKYEHSSARYYITGKHATYEVVDVEEIMSDKLLPGQ